MSPGGRRFEANKTNGTCARDTCNQFSETFAVVWCVIAYDIRNTKTGSDNDNRVTGSSRSRRQTAWPPVNFPNGKQAWFTIYKRLEHVRAHTDRVNPSLSAERSKLSYAFSVYFFFPCPPGLLTRVRRVYIPDMVISTSIDPVQIAFNGTRVSS